MDRYRVKPGTKLHLDGFDPADHHDCRDKKHGEELTLPLLRRLDELQERLYAEARHSLLLVLQGTDTAGKDGTIRHVMSGVNPQGCQVASFKQPTHEELAHDFLWRIHQWTPRKGNIGIFNRSHYEDVLVTRVHKLIDDDEAKRRFEEINDFEQILRRNGTTVVKFFLHISKDEQRQRLQERVDTPDKRWKLSASDLKERELWPDYQKAFEEALEATSTDHAPWYVIPANHKWYRNYVIAKILVDALEELGPKFPPADASLNYEKLKIT